MVKIVALEPDKSVVKECICQNCGETLAYVPNDLKEDYSSDYTGSKDYFNYIECPNCNKRIILRRRY